MKNIPTLAEFQGILAGADVIKNGITHRNPYKFEMAPNRHIAWRIGFYRTAMRHFCENICK